MNGNGPYLYVNLQNQWREPYLSGLVNDGGVLRLAQVPGQTQTVGPPLVMPQQVAGPAGIGVDDEGNLYLADPADHQVIRVDGCDGSSAPLPCLRGPGQEPGQLNGPRGLVVGPRRALYIADSGNHRVQVVDLINQQVRAIWGQPDPYAPPEPGDEPGRLNEPWDLAADQGGCLYVVDYGNRRVQKFTASGRVLPTFWETMQAATTPQEPAAVAVTLIDGQERLLVVDRLANAVLIYRLDGSFDQPATDRWASVPAQVGTLVDVVADEHFLYVADAASGRVLVFDQAGTFLGLAQGAQQGAAGLALDCQGRLLVHPGGGGAVQQLQPATAYVLCGIFLVGPLSAGPRATRWHRLHVAAGELPAGSHVQFFTLSSDRLDGNGGGQPALPTTCETTTGNMPTLTAVMDTPLDAWRAAPVDNFDLLLPNQPGRYLWLGALFQGNGQVSPAIEQIRLEYDHETWTRYLPAVHQNEPANKALLDQVLSLFESLLADEEALMAALPGLFDPWAASDEGAPDSWLAWLSGWLAFDLDETWSEEKRRATLAEAFRQYGRRGTVESLRWLIAQYAGATAHISEPAGLTSLWALGEFSYLGFDTMLVPAEAQGAVVGTTATLDHSHLISDEEYGAPLFSDVAHRFCLQVYAADLVGRNADLAQVRQVLEREKPAHTIYHLCPIEARMRVGFQARLGIDTIIAGPPPDLVLDGPRLLGQDTVLPAGQSQAVGHGVWIGRTTALG